MKASTELVPRINIWQITGAEKSTDCPIVRPALGHSPAMMATYSKPAQRADGHLAEDREAEPIQPGQLKTVAADNC